MLCGNNTSNVVCENHQREDNDDKGLQLVPFWSHGNMERSVCRRKKVEQRLAWNKCCAAVTVVLA
jgi:hypothetical protein